MTTTMPSRAAIDAAGELTFPDRKPARQDLTITIKATIDGFPTEVCFTGTIDQLLAVTRRLRELGASPTIAPAAPRRQPNTGITPAYDGNGQPMCPVHHKPIIEGRHGLYCPSKAEGEHANAKGFCNLKFAE